MTSTKTANDVPARQTAPHNPMPRDPHPNPQYAGIPQWAVYFAIDSMYDPREVWPAIQALGEEKARDANDERRLTLGRKDHGPGKVTVGILAECPRCKRPW